MKHFNLPAPYKPNATIDSVTKMPLIHKAGSHWTYGISNDWLTLVIQNVRGLSLNDYEQQRIFAPLGITDISYTPNPARISMAYGPSAPGEPFTFSTKGESFPTRHTGGAGLSGSPASYLKILRMLLRGGLAQDGVTRVLRQETVDKMFTPSLQNEQQRKDCREWTVWGADPFLRRNGKPFAGSDFGMGGLLTGEGYPSGRGNGAMTWSGYANTFWVVDRERDVAFGESAESDSAPSLARAPGGG